MDGSPVSISLSTAIDPPWMAMPPLRLGALPRAVGTPDLFALVSESGQPSLRLDLYRAADAEPYVRDEAIAWREGIVVGFGCRAFLIHSRHSCRASDRPAGASIASVARYALAAEVGR